MTTLVIGGSGSGKSAWAEDCLLSLSAGKRKYYLATMQAFGPESRKKVERHQRLRAGKGFFTLEQPTDIAGAVKRMEEAERAAYFQGERTALLECMSNLAANEMFSGKTPAKAVPTAEKILAQIRLLEQALSHLVIVTNNVFEDGVEYESTTQEYIRALGLINQGLAARADAVVELVVGIPLFLRPAHEVERRELPCTSGKA